MGQRAIDLQKGVDIFENSGKIFHIRARVLFETLQTAVEGAYGAHSSWRTLDNLFKEIILEEVN